MLIEIVNVQQIPGEPYRRWFSSKELDLILWLNAAGEFSSFQFCYNKGHLERALTWTPEQGFEHHLIDDGETKNGLRHKQSPALTQEYRSHTDIQMKWILTLFRDNSEGLPEEIIHFVVDKFAAHLQMTK